MYKATLGFSYKENAKGCFFYVKYFMQNAVVMGKFLLGNG